MLEDTFYCGFESTLNNATIGYKVNTKITDEIFELIDGKLSVVEIRDELGLTNKQVNHYLLMLQKQNKVEKVGTIIFKGYRTMIYKKAI